MIRFDLHAHSTASDGSLSPVEVWNLAVAEQLDYFALTDHDTVAGYLEIQAQNSVATIPTRLISGVEISCQYQSRPIHIVALNIDVDDAGLGQLLQEIQQIRAQRAEKIAQKLERIFDITRVMEDVQCLFSKQPQYICRPHFASYLHNKGLVSDTASAFKRYLGQGKKAYVSTPWPDYQRVIQAIVKAQGVAVLAHPLKYKLTRSRLHGLIQAFSSSGGAALELVAHQQKSSDTAFLQKLCSRYQLLASAGSDFHHLDKPWARIAQVPQLPVEAQPIWERF